jgi:hypothetical protein
MIKPFDVGLFDRQLGMNAVCLGRTSC